MIDRRSALLALWAATSTSVRSEASDITRKVDASECKYLQPNSDGSAVIWKSGCYVLASDIEPRWRWVIPEGGRKGPAISAMIPCFAYDLHIDLAGHQLRTETGALGVIARSRDAQESVPRQLLDAGLTRRLVLRNGRIKVWNSDGNRAAPAVVAADADSLLVIGPPKYPMPTSFSKIQYVLEDLDIDCTGGAAYLFGDGIAVRRCRIKVRGNNALVIYGPNAVVENNEIDYEFNDDNPTLVTAKYPKPPGYQPQIRSAIYLRAAHHAQVRGNTVTTVQGEHAVSLVDSEDVLIEGNAFSREEVPVLLHGQSSADMRDNRVGRDGLFTRSRRLPDGRLR